MRLALCLLVAAAVARADTTPPAASPATPRFCLTIGADAGTYRAGRDVALWSRLSVRGPRLGALRSSTLEVLDEQGRIAARLEHAFFARGRMEVGLGFASSPTPLDVDLPPGRYRARWIADGARSNLASFRVASDGAGDPPLAVDPAEDGGCPDEPLLLRLRNAGPRAIDLPEELGRSVLIVDGVRYPRQGVFWDGVSDLPPGRSWSTTISFAEYGAHPSPGRHQVTLEMAGYRAVVVTIVSR